jgi:predicted TIM-barrel fold metal-dependent hydrolase
MKIVDIHTHTFPPSVAAKAISKLEGTSSTKAIGSGLEDDLLVSMQESGVDISVVAPVATSPNCHSINLKSIASREKNGESLCFLGALHPNTPNIREEIAFLKENGFNGVKLHPDYQDFFVDEQRMFPIYEELEKQEMFLLLHCGEDVSFVNSGKGNPSRTAKILKQFPELKIIAAHLGGYLRWDETLEHLGGYENVWLDTAYCAFKPEPQTMQKIINTFTSKKILLGSDWPWMEQKKSIDYIKSLPISEEQKSDILGDNALRAFIK